MENIEKMIQDLHLDTRLAINDIPDLELYMDQVIQLFENKYVKTKRTPDEKILTKTMINNYSKGKLFFPIKNKKYTREHVMLINMIYEMKSVLAIKDIKHTLTKLNKQVVEDSVELEMFYKSFLELSESNVTRFLDNSREIAEEVSGKNQESDGEDIEYLQKVLLTLSFVNMSNYYRRAAEALIDEIEGTDTKKD